MNEQYRANPLYLLYKTGFGKTGVSFDYSDASWLKVLVGRSKSRWSRYRSLLVLQCIRYCGNGYMYMSCSRATRVH